MSRIKVLYNESLIDGFWFIEALDKLFSRGVAGQEVTSRGQEVGVFSFRRFAPWSLFRLFWSWHLEILFLQVATLQPLDWARTAIPIPAVMLNGWLLFFFLLLWNCVCELFLFYCLLLSTLRAVIIWWLWFRNLWIPRLCWSLLF